MITRTDAWRCRDGACFDDKERAYNHEIKLLLECIPKGTGKAIVQMQLKRLANEVGKWLQLANEFNESVARAPEDRALGVVKEFQGIVADVTKWLDDSKSLLAQITHETNIEVKRAMDGQGG